MGVLIAYPQNKEEADALKAFMKALEIRFEEVESIYDPEFEKKIERSRSDFEEGRSKSINTDSLF